MSKLALLLKLYYDPRAALTGLRSRSPFIVGILLALGASAIYNGVLEWGAFGGLGASGWGLSGLIAAVYEQVWSAVSPIIFLSVIFVPACILFTSLVDRRTGFRTLLHDEYKGLLSCVLYGWAATHLLSLFPIWALLASSMSTGQGLQPATIIAITIAPLPYFLFQVVLAIHFVLRLGYLKALAVIAFASVSLLALPLIPHLLFLFSSPFLIILIFLFMRNYLGEVFAAQRDRERFKQNLEAATLNPADSSAHYNLGLIHQQRGQFGDAKLCFQRAVEISPDEIDAHYQLGRIAREEGDLAEAIKQFDLVVRDSPDHGLNEVWREIGRTYFQAGQYEDSSAAFERFLEKRPTDAEGRYRYGIVLHKLGREEEASGAMRAVVEAVRTAPAFKYRVEKHWMNEAQSFLRSQSG
jgi:tetratricopeptide (TPR) repeat protein